MRFRVWGVGVEETQGRVVLKHHGSYQQQNRDLQVSTVTPSGDTTPCRIIGGVTGYGVVSPATQGEEGFEVCLEGFGVRG